MHTCILRRIASAPLLISPYDGPYKVIVRSGRVMKILIKGKVETVSLDRVKPAHFECETATGTTTQRTTPSKRRSSKTTGIVRRNSQFPLAPSSTHTQRSNRTSVKPTTTQSKATKHGTNLATASQQKAIRVKLPNKFKPYVAPHSRTPLFLALTGATSVCELIHMYLCIWGVKPLLQVIRANNWMLRTIRPSPMVIKL